MEIVEKADTSLQSFWDIDRREEKTRGRDLAHERRKYKKLQK